jgi:hypothetical protein
MTNLVISCFRPPESHPLRDLGQLVYAINQLERMQRARKEEHVPAPVSVQVSSDQ